MALHGSQHMRALYAVFIRPALGSQAPLLSLRAPAVQPLPPHHLITTSAPRLSIPRRSPKSAPRTAEIQQLRDNDIPARRVQVVDEQGQLREPQTKFSVMRSFDTSTHRLVCVMKPPRYLSPSDPTYEEVAANYDYIVEQYKKQQQKFGKNEPRPVEEEEQDSDIGIEIGAVHRAPAILVVPGKYIRLPSGEEWVPICKIENKAEAAARVRELAATRKEQKKLAPEGVKIIELNWAIDGNDLGHRLKKVEEFLRARRKVEVIIAPKRRGRKATREECDSLVKKIKDALGNVDGAKESRPMQGKVGEVASIMLEGNRDK
ncbi:hypothetical protein ANO11243_096760 [Dothideomycetidae sp. 11243]|nr:hypothetical protein ANO11243_096760 [fungal sp. No.11243]